MLKIDWLHPRKSPNAVGFHFAEQVLRKVDAAGKNTISFSLKKASLCSEFKLLKEVPPRQVPAPQASTMLWLGAEKWAVGEWGDFCSPHRNTLQRVSPLRVLVSSSWYLPFPLSPLVIVCTLVYVADKLVELIWDFFLLLEVMPAVEDRAPLLYLNVISKGTVWIKMIFLS